MNSSVIQTKKWVNVLNVPSRTLAAYYNCCRRENGNKNEMNELLLKVEGVFSITGRGVILAPNISLEQKLPYSPVIVIMKRPDGLSIKAKASFHIPHIHFAKLENMLENLKREQKYVCILKGIEKSEVPIGTEIWLDSNEPTEAEQSAAPQPP